MHFNVSQLLKESIGSVREYEIDDMLALIEPIQALPAQGNIRLLRTDRGVFVSGILYSSVVCFCSRCLEEYEQPVSMSIEQEYFQWVHPPLDTREPSQNGNENIFYIDQNQILDLKEAFRQYLDINTPMKPVCRENCSGMCPNCGVNNNRTACGCDNVLKDISLDATFELLATVNEDD